MGIQKLEVTGSWGWNHVKAGRCLGLEDATSHHAGVTVGSFAGTSHLTFPRGLPASSQRHDRVPREVAEDVTLSMT